MVILYKEAYYKSHHHLPLYYGIFGSGLDRGDEKHIVAVAKRSLGFPFVSLMFLMMMIIPTSAASLAYATTTTKDTSSGSSDYGISLGSDVGGNSTAGLVNSTQSGNNTGDNNSCSGVEPRERGGELGALAGELGRSSQFCGQ